MTNPSTEDLRRWIALLGNGIAEAKSNAKQLDEMELDEDEEPHTRAIAYWLERAKQLHELRDWLAQDLKRWIAVLGDCIEEAESNAKQLEDEEFDSDEDADRAISYWKNRAKQIGALREWLTNVRTTGHLHIEENGNGTKPY